jgi:hypothetical protein
MLPIARSGICAFILAGAMSTTGAESPDLPLSPSCATPEHRQFDFWVGDWEVSAQGKVAGVNRIERILGGCALLESWHGASGYRGNSLNFYDAGRKRWHQTWTDTSGLALSLEGEFAGGNMVLAGTRFDAGRQQTVHDRITWTPHADGTVRQLWETSTDGKTWSTLFDGLYARKPPAG